MQVIDTQVQGYAGSVGHVVGHVAGQVAWRVAGHLNRSLTAASLAPMYLLSTSGPFTLTSRIPAPATAAATM